MIFQKRGFKNQILVLIALLLVLPIVLAGYMLNVIHNTQLSMIESQKKKIAKAMELLDASLTASFDDLLTRANAAQAPRRDKVKLLNRQLKPLIVKIKENYPELELGFYSRDLDVILDGDENSYGENFSKRRKRAFDETISTSKPVVETLGLSEGGQLEMYRPLMRHGKVIGAVWATENLSALYRRVDRVQRDAYLVIAVGLLVGLGGTFALIRNLVAAVNQVKTGVQLLETDLTYVLPPATGELGEITEAINHLATKLVNVQNYNEIILASIDDGILAVDLRAVLIGVNAAAKRILGLPEDCLDKPLEETFPPDSPFYNYLTTALHEHRLVKDQEVLHPASEGKTLHLLISTNLMTNIRREIIGVVLTCRDITDRVHLEEQIRRQERLASLGKLVAGVAHEIRNPLTSISGYIQFWQKNPTPSPRSLSIIQREINRLNTIVDKLLHFARPAQAVFGIHDVNLLVNRVAQFFQDAHNSEVEIKRELTGDLPPAWMDPSQMEQVLYNVLYNAAQAMSGRGTIIVSTELEAEKNMVLVKVKDSGRGIPPEIMPHLFDPFFTTKPRGVGLGLAIAYEIIRAHGGEIELESQLGQGTTCKIYIPVAKEEG
ncbi:two-component system sensor histidine kinase AtoS [Desulfofundulus thermosubterraneus]|uniref:histidine kinase n=1 Tax=Desulfofundulus thermosubterraneus DSM 16057 TaxID=1121432 RepID=A0A1M6CBC8_9FIRM|nr:two-component system sensor histidine kinase AtoS [Desulfofundulus thermosubterraneus]SHI58094.1 two-component system, NtrC family, sensor histidine kinase AtoS [Desulfofundulus thermosubterraneus DSM 16057]